MRDGTRARIRVAARDADALVADDGRRFSRGDISEMRVRRFSPAKTIGLALGIAALTVVVVAVLVASSLDDMFSD